MLKIFNFYNLTKIGILACFRKTKINKVNSVVHTCYLMTDAHHDISTFDIEYLLITMLETVILTIMKFYFFFKFSLMFL